MAWADKWRKISTVGTVEDFWATFNWIVLPSQLRIGDGYCLFKAGVRPDWEDETNSEGGRWVIKSWYLLDYVWKEIAMTLVGSILGAELDETVVGVVANARGPLSNIGVWMGDNSLADKMGERLQRTLRESEAPCVWNAEYRQHN